MLCSLEGEYNNMAPPKTVKKPLLDEASATTNEDIDFSAELIRQINKEAGSKIAFNLGTDEAPTTVKRWISTGSKQLDYIISNRRNGGVAEGRIVEIQGPPSCHAKGTLLVEYNGALIKAEDVKVGTVLMGPDSKPRTVKSVHSGIDQMYRFMPASGAEPFVVNSNHILSLKRASSKKKAAKRTGEVVEISVREYLNTSNTFKKYHRLYRSNLIEFASLQEKELPVPAYILGLLIGDGSLGTLSKPSGGRVELTTADKEIEKEYTTYCNGLGYEVSIHTKADNKAIGLYHRTTNNTGQTFVEAGDKDQIRAALRQLGLLGTHSGNKFVPQVYKTATVQERFELLAGLIDTDGSLSKTRSHYEYCSKSTQLASDFAFIARSLGINAQVSHKFVDDEIYYRVNLSGPNIVNIPSRLERKKAIKTKSKKDYSLVGFQVEAIGEGEYYGFEVDADHLFLSHDFLVFHNSGKSHVSYEIAKSTQKMNGIVVYIDTENATSVENLEGLGIDIRKRFVFIQETCIEDIFKVIESTIEKARNLKADVPVTVIWDSVAASSPKAEIEGDYDQNTIGLAARVLSKGFRKVTDVIGDKNVCLVLLNQQRVKIGCCHPDTFIEYRNEQTTQNGTMRQMFRDVGLNFETAEINRPTPISGWEVQTIDEKGNLSWRKVLHAVRKQNAPHMRVSTYSGMALSCSPEHRLYVRNVHTGIQTYQEVNALEKVAEVFMVSTIKGWESFHVERIDGDIEIADIEVEGEHSYLSNGILSHNTMYGDPSCVSPDTQIKVRKYSNVIEKAIAEELTLAELFNRFNISSFELPMEVDISDDYYDIESWDVSTQRVVWKPITALVVKPSVQKHYRLGSLKGTSVHRVLHNREWVELQHHPEATLVEEPMEVVDMMVEDTECYLAEGQINHNTTPGGMAIPYHASTRIKLTGGQQLKQVINGKEAVIGINVTCKTIKNKVARPWREVSFEIHFGKGIREAEQVFDELRDFCDKCKEPVILDGKRILIEGAGGWKTFQVSSVKTGEILIEEKFHKSEFGARVLDNPEYTDYVTALMDATFIMKNGDDNHKTVASIDLGSATEVEAVKVEKQGKAGKSLLMD